MFRNQTFSTPAAQAVMGWVASIAIMGGFHDCSAGPGVARADFMFKDAMREDQGYTAWDSKYAFSERGMSPFGVVTREVKEMPSQFDAAITIDASKASVWGFGVAGDYSPKTGYSGIGFTANADAEIGVMFAYWDQDVIVDAMRIDADATKMLNGVHRIAISVREQVAYAAIDDQIVGKIAYSTKWSGSQIVFASFSDDATYFRDLSIVGSVPSPGVAAMIGVAGVMVMGGRRRR